MFNPNELSKFYIMTPMQFPLKSSFILLWGGHVVGICPSCLIRLRQLSQLEKLRSVCIPDDMVPALFSTEKRRIPARAGTIHSNIIPTALCNTSFQTMGSGFDTAPLEACKAVFNIFWEYHRPFSECQDLQAPTT